MAEPNKKLKNMKVLSLSEKGTVFSKRQNKDVKKYEILLQGVDDQSVVLTGEAFEPLPEEVKKDGVVEDVWVYEDTYNDKVTTKFFFPKKKDGGSSKPYSGGYRGMSKEELEYKYKELILRVVSFGYSYAKDILVATSTGEITAAEYEEFGDSVSKALHKTVLELS